MITIPKSVEYSVIFISYLSKHASNFISLKEISQKANLPYRYLSKLAASLGAANIVDSQEGKSGGYKLKTGWQKKSFYDLLIALGENKALVSCLGGKICAHSHTCSIRSVWQQIETAWQLELKKIKLSQI